MDSRVDQDTLPPDQQVEAATPKGFAALAGAVSAGLALGLTELFAGIFERVPSAISAVGAIVVDRTPSFVERVAIQLFGTADKGALAIGTVIIGIGLGAIIGVLATKRRWVGTAGFGLFAVVGILAALGEPLISPIGAMAAIVVSALIGLFTLRRLLRSAAVVETPTDGRASAPGRRRFIAGAAAAGAGALIAGYGGRALIIKRSDEVREALGYPQPVTRVEPPGLDASFDVEGLEPIVVPNDSFYRIDTALIVPRIDPATWSLGVTGLVDRELSLSMDDLLAMPLHEKYVTIACVSNEVGGDLIGNAKWTGVRLAEVLDEAGVRPEASQVVGRSIDGWTAGFPTEVVFDGRDPLIAIAMNDELLPRQHGFPARLIVPGLYGYVSATKWLEEIELTTWDAFDGYWIPRGWSKEGPIKTQSRIDHPRPNERVAAFDGVLAGVAWAPTRGVSRVEVRVDDGPWQAAEISNPLSDQSWVQWRADIDLAPGEHRAQVRATDGTGEAQTEIIRPPDPDGATGYHTIEFFIA